ncbi:hypothetical protein EYR40_000916 [Pleurotus pulmonarius]|nr:hypothetical protein EYR38_004161 [Pleurotus pulmonarius]KAF4608571.1 hypothetical protein EYR40_000916 [Pleurotus pulmonarius]
MQSATHPRLHVRDMRDAHTVLEAVRLGILRPVTRRLNEMERSMHIRSGAIFVWEESDEEVGLKRWTDGRVWSQSRMREPYLFYDEKLPGEQDIEPPKSPTYRFVDGVNRGAPVSSAMSHHDRSPRLPAGLIKQAYSAWVIVSPGARPRKWHLTAYFTYADLQNIPTPDRDPMLRGINVPPGIYRSGKIRSKSGDEDSMPEYSALPPTTPSGPSRATSYPNDRVLPSLQSTVGNHGGPPMNPPRHGMRLPEDQRLIEMLNSRLVL